MKFEHLPETQPFESDDGPFHLDYEQHLKPYVDGKADDIDREIVASHVALCSMCAAELEDLLEFKQQPVAAIPAEVPTSSRWWPQLPLLSRPAWAAAAAVLAVFVLGLAVLMWTRYRESRSVQRVESLPDSQKAQPSPAPAAHTPQTSQANVSPLEEPLLVLNDGGRQVTLNQRGQLEGLEQLPPDLKASIERALATHRLGALRGLRGWSAATNNLRSGLATQTTFAPLAPVGVVIETDRPTFRWRPLEGSQHCIVTVYDAKLRQVASSGPVTRAEWTTPNSLQRGVTYSWQISAEKNGETVVSPKPPLPEARFRVLDQRAVDALAQVRQSAGTSHLALGVFYWKHGLVEEAEHEFQVLANANPNSTPVKQLLASIGSLRRR